MSDFEIVYNDLDEHLPPKVFKGIEEDDFGHAWNLGWEESDMPHPGFGGSTNIYGGYVDQCAKCGMYSYEFLGPSDEHPGKYELQPCGDKIRD